MRFTATLAMLLLAAAGSALLTAGCGYSARGLRIVRRLEIPIFENVSDRRLNEFELTETVSRELESAGVAVNSDTPYVLHGKIVRITEPRLVEGATSDVLVSSESVTVDIKVVNRDTGRVLRAETITESAPFSSTRGQTVETARREVFDRVAKRVAQALVMDW